MQLHFSDPELPRWKTDRVAVLGQYWRQGQIGDATFLRSLFVMGWLPDEANTELNLLKMERRK